VVWSGRDVGVNYYFRACLLCSHTMSEGPEPWGGRADLQVAQEDTFFFSLFSFNQVETWSQGAVERPSG